MVQCSFVCDFMPYQQYFSYLTAIVDKSMFPCNQSIILTLAGQLYCYSNNPKHQGGKPLLPALKTLVCGGRGSNPQHPAHKADTLTTRPPQQSKYGSFN